MKNFFENFEEIQWKFSKSLENFELKLKTFVLRNFSKV